MYDIYINKYEILFINCANVAFTKPRKLCWYTNDNEKGFNTVQKAFLKKGFQVHLVVKLPCSKLPN